MFRHFKLLPGEVAKQKPRLLFSMLEEMTGETETDTGVPNIPHGNDWMIGL
jgi:hypothetical protein